MCGRGQIKTERQRDGTDNEGEEERDRERGEQGTRVKETERKP